MNGLVRGAYRVRTASTGADLTAAQRLRCLAFRGNRAGPGRPASGSDEPRNESLDTDDHDRLCRHVLVEDIRSDALVCTFRLLPIASGRDIGRCYSARHYDLSALEGYDGPMAEMGRFCLHPAHHDPDIVRIAWAAVTRLVDRERIGMLFGCTSFPGTDAEVHRDAFALLKERHLAPPRWRPKARAERRICFSPGAEDRQPDRRAAMRGMPTLLRTYLAMGGWVSDHAVVDPDLDTLHVFTGLEIGRIPPARARSLRLVAG